MTPAKRSAVRRLLAAAALCTGAGAGAAPASYVLDPERSFVHFEVVHFGTSTIRGRFGPAQGSVLLDPGARRAEADVRVATASVDTGVRPFDARLRRDDLLASEAHPEAFFVARQARFDGERLAELRGEFTMRGVSQPLTLRALHFACRADAAGEVCGGDFEAELLRSSIGATFGLPFIADRVRLLVQVEGRRR
ncbi:MAG: YceI family protein [Rubrivivax sp.]|nr:YceI family protein [Rubrivivax sp.]MCW5609203.1 YceI family protein [Rubrivivax sp.]